MARAEEDSSQAAVYNLSGIGSADLQVGCRAGLLARAGTLAARTPLVQSLLRAALLKCAING
jgi:hypothetical protein